MSRHDSFLTFIFFPIFYLKKKIFEIIIDPQEVARVVQSPFPQLPPMATTCISTKQYKNQEIDIGKIYKPYLDCMF